ncbi:ead/Ea22-like family protein [Salmonella enterica]|nr:ead/Ea22-like family protein [Salmonella enterica]
MKDKQALREAAERAMHDDWGYDTDIFHEQVTPSVVLALLDENLQLQREKDATEAVALALRDDMRQAREQLAAAERRIAELEAREVMLPDRKSEIFWPGDAAEFDILGYVIAVKSAIRAAGIKVKES